MFETFEKEKEEVLEMLRCTQLVLSREGSCKMLTSTSSDTYDPLFSTQEEADTKVIAHATEFLNQDASNRVVMRSPSGDTDIIVLCVALLTKDKVVIDNSSGKARKSIWLGGLELSESKCAAVLGLHAFSGNDYISSFFKKGKEKCWKLMEKYEKFETCFANFGSESMLQENDFHILQEFVSLLYGVKAKSSDEARWKIFQQKHLKESKITDLSLLPPCDAVLRLHSTRANAVAYLWRNSNNPLIEFPSLEESGWTSTGEVFWMMDSFPVDVEELLTSEYDSDEAEESNDEDESSDEYHGSDVDSVVESEDEFE